MSILTITPRAEEQMCKLIEKRNKATEGIRISVKTRGCTGLSYTIEYVDSINPLDECIQFETCKIFVDVSALLYILGTEIDFEESELSSGFTFKNPKEKGRCGCGESFRV
jgi:iron-sulfur cluster assembly protein